MRDNRVLTYDELLQERNIYSNILNKETMKYIDALLTLDISAVDKENLDVIRDIALFKLKFFRDIVAFNIFENSKRIVELDGKYYNIIDNDSLFICTKSDSNVQSVLYNFDCNYNEDDKFTINIYGDKVISMDERVQKLNDAIARKKEEIQNGAEESLRYSEYIQSHEYYKLAKQLEALKKMTTDDLKTQYEADLLLSQERKRVLDAFLDNNKLSISSDFIQEGNDLVGYNPYTKMIIKNYTK